MPSTPAGPSPRLALAALAAALAACTPGPPAWEVENPLRPLPAPPPSVPTPGDVVRTYDRGGIRNPRLAPEMKPLGLTPAEIDALAASMEALGGGGFDDVPPAAFPM